MVSSTRPDVGSSRHRTRLLLLVGLIAVLFPLVGPVGEAEAACTLTARTTTERIGSRSYRLRVPSGLTGPAMLVISLHPGTVSAASWDPVSGWNAKATTNKFVVAYPQGGAFNTWDSNNPNGTDYPFLVNVINDIKAKVCINNNKVHFSGYSMGGWMSQRMACQLAGTVASVGGGGMGHPELHDDWWPEYDPEHGNAWACNPSRPIAVHLSMGTNDNTSYGLAARDQWRSDDSCGATPTTQSVSRGAMETWTCASGSHVVWRTYTGFTHISAADPNTTPKGPYLVEGVNEEYAFFVAHPKP